MENDNNANGNLNDNSILDALVLTREQWKSEIVRTVTFTLIAVVIFFVPVIVRGSMDVTFGIIYKNIKAGLEPAELWTGGIIIMGNGLVGIYGKYFYRNRDSAVYRYYQEDSVLYPLFYLLGSIFVLVLMLHYTFPSSEGPATIVSPGIRETVYSIAMSVAWIVPVSIVFIPFLLNYRTVDFIDSLMEPLMRPVFKIPGGSAVNATAPFVSSASMGVLIANKLYQKGIYTRKEATLTVMRLSAANMGFAYKMIETADLSEYFLPTYFIALLVILIVSPFMVGIPPLPHKVFVFAGGRQQTEEETLAGRVPVRAALKMGISRAVKKAATAPNLLKEIRSSLLDNCYVLPKVTSLPTAMGIITMLIVTYTPVFGWIDKLFEPLSILSQVPNTAEITSSLPVGIAKMFLPALMIAGEAGTLAMEARYIVVIASMVQIIFFSETIVVVMSAKVPVPLKELIVYFSERVTVAIPISALFMRLLF